MDKNDTAGPGIVDAGMKLVEARHFERIDPRLSPESILRAATPYRFDRRAVEAELWLLREAILGP